MCGSMGAADVILRWALAWYRQRGISEAPAALRELPPLQSQT
ncbi:hypothetical protein [Streptomyces sp. NPDC001205]